MAGAVRQHIDVVALSRYIGEHVVDIRLPIALQQVPLQTVAPSPWQSAHVLSVWLWAIQPDVPDHQ